MEGVAIILCWALAGKKSHSITGILVPLLTFVVVPMTYILNRETTKQLIVLENWMEGLRSTFLTAQDAQAKVNRIQVEMQEQRNNPPTQNRQVRQAWSKSTKN